MCSISGILITSFDSDNADLKGKVRRMNTALYHRGPDDDGIFEARRKTSSQNLASICLGNTRLAIIDTSAAGHQPMVDEETGMCITYNGETYNFRDLKSEIGTEFGPWHSTTDTEVVLRVYRKWGIEGFKKLRGMFALAIWDPTKGELLIARDPFGIKPVYYFASDETGSGRPNQFLFSSEVRALLASGSVRRKLSREGLSSYLTYGSTQAPWTMVENVRSVMPGECLIVRPHAHGLDIKSIAIATNRTPISVSGSFESRKAAAVVLRDHLEETVRTHLVSDVPLGVFLSGGMDSSALVALMSRVSKGSPRTFSVVFEDDRFSEARFSRLVADQFRTVHQEIQLGEDQLLRMLPEAIQSFDLPSMDGINTFVVSRAVKQAGVTVALSGLGGDELFAGYPTFRRALQMNSVSPFTRRFMRSVAAAGRLAAKGDIRRNKLLQLAQSAGRPADVYRISRQLFDPKTVLRLSGSKYSDDFTVTSTSDVINEVSRLEIKGYMANTLLRDADNMSMAHSLEVRVPFVDVNVAGFSLSLPGKLKLNGDVPRVSKPLLVEAISDLLPREFLARRKMGFTLPFENWMQSRLMDDISRVLLNRDRLAEIGLDTESVGNIWKGFLKSPRHIGWSRPWSLYVLSRWCEANGVSQ